MKTLTSLCIALLLAACAAAQTKYPTRDWNRRPTTLPANDDSTWKATISITRTDQVTGGKPEFRASRGRVEWDEGRRVQR